MEILISILVVSAVGIIYFLPCIIASQRKHPQSNAIGVINFFLGWTLIGWVGALAWSVTNKGEYDGKISNDQ